MSTIIIEDKEYEIEKLPQEVQANIARAHAIQQEINDLRMVIEERILVLQARQNTIVQAVKAAEGDPEDADAA